MSRPLAQSITVKFKNGKVGRFVGPAVLGPDDGAAGRIGIESVQIGHPYQISDGSFFAETRDGQVVLMKQQGSETVHEEPPN